MKTTPVCFQDESPSLKWLRNSAKPHRTITNSKACRSLRSRFNADISTSSGKRTTTAPKSTFSPFISSNKSPYTTPALNLEQRKSLLMDSMENRVLEQDITSKWGYAVLISLTVLISFIIRIMDISYYFEPRNQNINQSLYVAYDISTWVLPSLPLWCLVISTIFQHRHELKRIQLFSVIEFNFTTTPTTTSATLHVIQLGKISIEWCITALFICFIVPVWILAGEILFSLKLFSLGKHVTKKWWSILNIIGITKESDTTRLAHLRTESLCAQDLSYTPSTPSRHILNPFHTTLSATTSLTTTPLTPTPPSSGSTTMSYIVDTPSDTNSNYSNYTPNTPLSSSSSSSFLSSGGIRSRHGRKSSGARRLMLGTSKHAVHNGTENKNQRINELRNVKHRHPQFQLLHKDSKLLMNSIQKKAANRRRRLATNGNDSMFHLVTLAMPRYDLTIDVVTLNKMILIECLFKYLPQFLLQYFINNALSSISKETEGTELGWTTSAVITCVTSGLSLMYTAYGSYQTWKKGSWASDLPDLDVLYEKVCAILFRSTNSTLNKNKHVGLKHVENKHVGLEVKVKKKKIQQKLPGLNDLCEKKTVWEKENTQTKKQSVPVVKQAFTGTRKKRNPLTPRSDNVKIDNVKIQHVNAKIFSARYNRTQPSVRV